MSLSPVVPPAVALALDWDTEVKGHLRLDSEDERARVEGVLVPAATQWAETFTGRAFTTQTWKLHLDKFPNVIFVPKPPLVSVTHIKYRDTVATQQTLDPSRYLVSAPSGPYALHGRITPAYGDYWPTTLAQMDAVEVQFVCGYGAEFDSVPAALRAAMLLHVGELFERRGDVIVGTIVQDAPLASKSLAGPFRLKRYC